MFYLKLLLEALCDIEVQNVLKSKVDFVLTFFFRFTLVSFSTIQKRFWTTQNVFKLNRIDFPYENFLNENIKNIRISLSSGLVLPYLQGTIKWHPSDNWCIFGSLYMIGRSFWFFCDLQSKSSIIFNISIIIFGGV